MGHDLENARTGTIEFMRNCDLTTAVAIHFMNTRDERLAALSSNLVETANLLQNKILSSGGTPFFTTLRNAMAALPIATRYVLFTDGEPTDALNMAEDRFGDPKWKLNNLKENAKSSIEEARKQKAPIDTVFFGSENEWTETAREFLKFLSDSTGGYFMVFDPAKVSFKTAFKYLAPTHRKLLASESVRKEIENGKRA
jgi:hypothetical protein